MLSSALFGSIITLFMIRSNIDRNEVVISHIHLMILGNISY